MESEIIYLRPSEIEPYYNNPRRNDNAVPKVAESIQAFGFQNPIIVDKNKVIIAGHTRWKAALKLELEAVPVIVTDLPEEKAKAYRITDNRIGEFAEWDYELLEDELSDIDEEIQRLLDFDIPETTNIVDGLIDDDEIPEVKEAITKPGDLWQLGRHRLLCGDATSSGDVERLMDGDKADMIFTDPPYGVDYEGKTKEKLKIKNDAMDEQELKDFISSSFDATEVVLRGGAYCIATVPAGRLHLLFAQDWVKRDWLRQIMVWNKDSMVLGHSEYHYKHEPILFGWKPGGDRLKNNDRTKTTVWDFARPKRSAEHPTMKPVEMWVYGINNHTRQNDIIYDPFSGSGTTIIAAEKTNRKCYGMEIDPHYCDVIIKRWEDFTGKKAELIDD